MKFLPTFSRRISRIALKFSLFEYPVHGLDEYLYTYRVCYKDYITCTWWRV